MRFPAQEVIIGALLTLAAFAMGMMWASAGAPSAHDTTHNTGEFKFGEWLTAFATIALVVVTYLLFQATQLLAKSAQEDSHNRKIQATADAWMDLRAELEFPNLTNTPAHEINAMGKEVVPQLRKLEGFSQIVNSGVFDLETFSKMSGNWFVQQVGKMKPYIHLQQQRNPDAYKEIVELEKKIRDVRAHQPIAP